MKNAYTGLKNKTILGKILTDSAYTLLADSFYTHFCGGTLTDTQVDVYAAATFVIKGAFSEHLEIIGRDASGAKQLLRIRFIEMHPGLTSCYFEVPSGEWRDLKMQIRHRSAPVT